MNYPRIMITACGSGSGKTTVMCALLAALKNRMNVSAFKCGPDYIDPMFHTALGTNCVNLDPFFCDEKLLRSLFVKYAGVISLIEGVMGFYDGMEMTDTAASSYSVARALDCPAVLVVNARGMAASLLAVVEGMKNFRPDSNICGVILNNVSEHVFKALAPAIENMGIAALGFLPKDENFALESRHLGLVTPAEMTDMERKMRLLGESAEKHIDLDRLINLAETAPKLDAKPFLCEKKYDLKIGAARDKAFCFYYKANLDMLREKGCELVYFSPLEDEKLPDGLDGLIIGGGYPELYLEKLSRNISVKNSIKTALECGLPCLAECGGFMYLQKSIDEHEMVGFIDSASENKGKLVRFGYITLTNENGEKIKAHEFHYYDSTDNGAEYTATKHSGKQWKCIHKKCRCICGYPHIFYPANEEFLDKFLELCKKR